MDKKILVEIANLEVDCKIGKDRHFIAADRKNKLRIILGIFAVIGSAVISSGIGESTMSLIGKMLGGAIYWDELKLVIGHVLPLLVGISTAIIGFLGLEKQTAQHRYVGNAYIEIARKARSIINSISDSNYEEKHKLYEQLMDRYLEINKEGELCPTNDKDSKKAMSMNSKRRSLIKNKVAEFEKDYLGDEIKSAVKTVGMFKFIARSLKLKLAVLLHFFGFIRKSDFRKYCKALANK